MQVTTVGLDLAKNIFQVHGIDNDGEVIFNRALRRAQNHSLNDLSHAWSALRRVERATIGRAS
jgi:hypothetical protein